MNPHIFIDKITHDTFYNQIKTVFASNKWCVLPPEEYISYDLNQVHIYTRFIKEFRDNETNKKYTFQQLCDYLMEVINTELKESPPQQKHKIIFTNANKEKMEYDY